MITVTPLEIPNYVRIERKSVKHLRLVVNRDASVRLVLPKRVALRDGVVFFQARKPWVEAKREQLLAEKNRADTWAELDSVLLRGERYQVCYRAAKDGVNHSERQLEIAAAESASSRLRVWRQVAADDIRARVYTRAKAWGLELNRLTIRDQKSRWGSCSSKRNISLNWRVALLPVWVGDYIIAHEFAHLLEMNHSPQFWAEVERLHPNYRQAEQWLKQQGSVVMRIQR